MDRIPEVGGVPRHWRRAPRQWLEGATGVMTVACVAVLVAVVPPGAGGASAAPPAWVRTAIGQLTRLPVRPADSMVRYSRESFGPAWEDVDGNHCDTRNDILRRDLRQVVLKRGSRCIVVSGVLHDPYTGETIDFVRGVETSTAVQIDHVVALADAWRTGASRWTPGTRVRYANDPFVLLAVDGPANEAKSDADAAEWLPLRAYQCRYVAKQVSIKTRYQLWITAAEHAALKTVLNDCAARYE